ncbi:conserved hypothetical protein [Coccidioides posadasii str. Silveira]|uniref:Uncharacterized protein n=1 Tax=Coccidioides posadasii (strain RMSCC 757 / Silveira) TaxID=443226 RepID=E9DHF0_COCPS|nr:conserved hypothetical protein [Coccidioides posadasii str. Silveira]
MLSRFVSADAYSVHPSHMRCTQTMIDVCGPILWLRDLEPASTSKLHVLAECGAWIRLLAPIFDFS